MATLQNIRNRGPLLVIVIGVALLAFVLGDLFSSGSTLMGRARDRASVVNGEVVTTQQYAENYRIRRVPKWLVVNFLDENNLSNCEAVYQQREIRLLRPQVSSI